MIIPSVPDRPSFAFLLGTVHHYGPRDAITMKIFAIEEDSKNAGPVLLAPRISYVMQFIPQMNPAA